MLKREQCEFGRPSNGKRSRQWATTITRVGPDSIVNGILLNERWIFPMLHWLGRHHVICTRPTGSCVGCAARTPADMHCYISWLVEGFTRPEVLHITERMYQSLPVECRESSSQRGSIVEVRRHGKARNSPRTIRYYRVFERREELTAGINVGHFVLQMYSSQDIDGTLETGGHAS